jgi:hypothetical protein
MQISESIEFNSSIEAAYAAFADLDRWPMVLPDTQAVEVLYSDGYNQEFTMTVTRPGGAETVRGVRYCRAPYELELVQTTPPPLLRRMTGRWTFREHQGGTTVVADREFELMDGARGPDGSPLSPEVFAEGLRRTLRTNLDLFRRAVETDVGR